MISHMRHFRAGSEHRYQLKFSQRLMRSVSPTGDKRGGDDAALLFHIAEAIIKPISIIISPAQKKFQRLTALTVGELLWEI